MRMWFYFMAVGILLFSPVTVRAQGEIRLESVSVQLWPEFDKPSMLVIYELTLAANTILPLDLNVHIPPGGKVLVVAVGTAQTAVTDQGIEYELNNGEQWTTITIKNVSGRAIRVEYYDNLEKQGNNRRFLYNWAGDFKVDNFTIHVQLPVDASNLQTSPTLPDSYTGDNGLTYYTSGFGALNAGETFTLSVDYTKTSDTLSASRVNPQSANPASAIGRVALENYLPWGLGILGVGLIVFGLWVGVSYIRSNRGQIGAGRARHAPRGGEEAELSTGVYCHQCGRRAQPGDLFCRACGTRLRHEQQ